MKVLMIIVIMVLVSSVAYAGEADVLKVRVEHVGDRHFTFHVTVKHADDGWDHYANKWEVYTLDGKALGTRVLMHPHDNEQPFTRSLGGVLIDASIKQVVIRAHDSVHGSGGESVQVVLPK